MFFATLIRAFSCVLLLGAVSAFAQPITLPFDTEPRTEPPQASSTNAINKLNPLGLRILLRDNPQLRRRDPLELQVLDSYKVSATEAEKFAYQTGLHARTVAEFPTQSVTPGSSQIAQPTRPNPEIAALQQKMQAQFRAVNAHRGQDPKPQPEPRVQVDANRDLVEHMLGATPLVSDRNLQRYINEVGRWLASQSALPEISWTFGVLDSPAVFTFSSPSGYVLITRGLYNAVEDEAQLAGVLSHEIGHVVKGHLNKLLHLRISLRMMSAAQSMMSIFSENPEKSQLSVHMVERMSGQFLRQSERQADAFAVILAARAGYTSYGLVEWLEKISSRSAQKNSLHAFNDEYPQANERLDWLRELISKHAEYVSDGIRPALRIELMSP